MNHNKQSLITTNLNKGKIKIADDRKIGNENRWSCWLMNTIFVICIPG